MVDKLKESVVQEDLQQNMNFIQNCLHLQSTNMGCLHKALDYVLDASITLASNLLLDRWDDFLKLTHRKVTDKDIAKLRNAFLTKKELVNSKVLSEVDQNLENHKNLEYLNLQVWCQYSNNEGQEGFSDVVANRFFFRENPKDECMIQGGPFCKSGIRWTSPNPLLLT